jgi:hypothetical protein
MKLFDKVALCEKYEGETEATRAIKRWIALGDKVWSSRFEVFFRTRHVIKPDAKKSFDTYPSFSFDEETRKIALTIYGGDDNIDDNSEEEAY